MLHVSGASRCNDQMKNCLEGCYVNGNKDGKPDEHINQLLERDQSGKGYQTVMNFLIYIYKIVLNLIYH